MGYSKELNIAVVFLVICFIRYCGTVSLPARPPKICKKPQKFFSTHNATIDTLLSLRYLEDTPFEREEMVAPFLQYSENYLIEPRYNLLTCNIPKVLSTIRVGLFWLLNNQTSYNASNYSLSLGDWDQFSDYCFQCKDNISCYAEEQYRRFMLYSNGLILDQDHGMEDFHFAPQTWFCKLGDEFYNYRQIKYEYGSRLERMVDDVIDVLKDSCVEEPLLRRIKTEMMEGRTGHTTRGSVSRSKYEDEIRSNPKTTDLLMKMYYYDYVAFGYPLPTAV